MEEHARPEKHKNTPQCIFLPAFLNKRRRHFAEAVGALGCLSSGVKSSVFRFPQALLSQFPQHPEKHRTTNSPMIMLTLLHSFISFLRNITTSQLPTGSIRNSLAWEAITQITGRFTPATLKKMQHYLHESTAWQHKMRTDAVQWCQLKDFKCYLKVTSLLWGFSQSRKKHNLHIVAI